MECRGCVGLMVLSSSASLSSSSLSSSLLSFVQGLRVGHAFYVSSELKVTNGLAWDIVVIEVTGGHVAWGLEARVTVWQRWPHGCFRHLDGERFTATPLSHRSPPPLARAVPAPHRTLGHQLRPRLVRVRG
jgi:hypothetical protein